MRQETAVCTDKYLLFEKFCLSGLCRLGLKPVDSQSLCQIWDEVEPFAVSYFLSCLLLHLECFTRFISTSFSFIQLTRLEAKAFTACLYGWARSWLINLLCTGHYRTLLVSSSCFGASFRNIYSVGQIIVPPGTRQSSGSSHVTYIWSCIISKECGRNC